ncbi:30S ribosomal protein S31, chloroplastic [Nymphaea colorata]|nr:30S ribosomal protein S31, chloroplastic [Nymphaea colorata]
MALALVGNLLSMPTHRHLPDISSLSITRHSTVGFPVSSPSSSSLSLVVSPLPQTHHLVYCGRGDKKTAKGKRFRHSYGNARPRNKKKGRGPARPPTTPAPPRKDRFDDGEIIKIELDESLFSN